MTKLLLISAILLSVIAEYYSIQGLMAIFSGAAISVAVMGVALGISKLVVSSWLYRNWNITPRLLRSYFVAAILVLMLLTSMGIFGFLSKAHSDQNLVSGDVVSQLSLIEEQIKIEKENIDAARKIISQLDSQVNETISRTSPGNSSTGASNTSGDAGISRSISIRRGQAKERSAAQETILSAQGKISKLNETKAPIAAKVRAVEAEVGPIKYIAALIYGDEAKDQTTLEAAVRWMILLIVAVFDPLAVLMFIAVNQDMARKKDIIEPEKIESPDTLKTDEIKIEPEIEKIKPKKTRRVREPKTEWERDRILIPVDDGEST